jgi:hypothetical protein
MTNGSKAPYMMTRLELVAGLRSEATELPHCTAQAFERLAGLLERETDTDVARVMSNYAVAHLDLAISIRLDCRRAAA